VRDRQIMAVAERDQEDDRAAANHGERVDFCDAPAARAADRLLADPLLHPLPSGGL